MEKKLFWGNLAFYLLFPILGIVIGMFVLGGFTFEELTETSAFGQAMFLTWLPMFYGAFYYFGYEHFIGRPNLARLFKILGFIFNIISILIVILVIMSYSLELSELTTAEYFKYAIIFAPLPFGICAQKIYRLIGDNIWPDWVQIAITVAFPIVCYFLTVLFLSISLGWCCFVLFAVVWLGWIYYEGYIEGFKKFVFNLVFYLSFFIISIVLATNRTLDPVILFGGICMLFEFFNFLSWDFCEKGLLNKIFTYVGTFSTLILGVITTFSVLGTPLEGLEWFRTDLSHAFVYAIYYFPILFFLFRYPLYMLGYQNKWSSLTQFTVTIALPVACYLLSVVFLLIGFLIPLIVIVLALALLAYITKVKQVKVTVPSFVSDRIGGSSDDTLNSRADCPGLNSDLKYGINYLNICGWGWRVAKQHHFSVDYNDYTKTVYIEAIITTKKDGYISEYEVKSKIEDQVSKVIRNYQSKNPETKGVSFSISYDISVVED